MKLTDHLSDNYDAVLEILDDLGIENIRHDKVKRQIRFSRDTGRNPSSMLLNLDTLSFFCFSNNEKGNIFTLVMDREDLDFPQSLQYIATKLKLDKHEFNTKVKYPFGGFYKQLIREMQEPEFSMQTYDDDVLLPYSRKFNTMFFNDGIDFQTQKEFEVGFDIETLRITIPNRTLDGRLCGVMGRLNDKNCEKEERWLPIIPCSRSLTLYGYHNNYRTIQEKGIVVIGESEKFVQQLHSMGSMIGLASCGCTISDTQAKYIKGLLVPKVIIAYDEGLDEDCIIEQAQKIKVDNALFKNNVGYIIDKNNEILPLGSKASPSDFGKQAFQELIQKHVRWLE